MKRAMSISELTRQNVETIAKMETAFQSQRTFGERVADGVTAMVGSWPFIVVQTVMLILWMVLNVVGWFYQWDPYPFILLNLALSFQAAYASPIIMMSQNRQAELNERRNRLDLQINLLAEQENTEMLKLLRLLCGRLGVPLDQREPAAAFTQPTCPEEVVRQLEGAAKTERAINGHSPADTSRN